MPLFLVMVGGFFGTVSRYILGESIVTKNGFPLGTLIINLVGCFILGWLLTYVSRRKKIRSEYTLIFGTGFIGSFTTFSTFSYETIGLLQDGFVLLSLVYVLTTVFIGLFLSFLGFRLALLSFSEGRKV